MGSFIGYRVGPAPRSGGRPEGGPSSDRPGWAEYSYFTGAAITFLAGVLSAAGWLWSATDGRFDDMPLGRLLLVAVLLVPAVAASFILALGGGFLAMTAVTSVRAGISPARRAGRRNARTPDSQGVEPHP
ncbi:hypothetical protein ACFRAR_16225 [Kitasatospora sp. NPDC056651]|uniref:hypothetical protein n=1 Tax=Kitasatospora sp. NPDC056651 TaxID=3345892 RepID=UPI003697BCE7